MCEKSPMRVIKEENQSNGNQNAMVFSNELKVALGVVSSPRFSAICFV